MEKEVNRFSFLRERSGSFVSIPAKFSSLNLIFLRFMLQFESVVSSLILSLLMLGNKNIRISLELIILISLEMRIFVFVIHGLYNSYRKITSILKT